MATRIKPQMDVERDDRECKKLIKAYRDWLLAFDDLRLTVEDLIFHSWSPEKPVVSGRGA